jgi:DNA-binding NarL/FixJ family response regulator
MVESNATPRFRILEETLPGRPTAAELGLTDRQYQVCELHAQALPQKEVAFRLGLSVGTVKIYFSDIYSRLNLDGGLALMRFWINRVENRGDCRTCTLRLAHMGGPLEMQ